MILIDLEGQSRIANLFKCDLSYIFEAADETTTDLERRMLSTRAELLAWNIEQGELFSVRLYQILKEGRCL